MTMPNPLGDPLAVQITGREIYDAVVRLTGRVDVLIEQQAAVREDIQDHEQRLRLLEETRPAGRIKRLEEQVAALQASRWPLPSVAALVGLAGLVVAVISLMTR